METVSTRSEGIFVMPETRINILSSYVHIPPSAGATSLMSEGDGRGAGAAAGRACSQQLEELQQRFDAQAMQMQEMRSRRLPG